MTSSMLQVLGSADRTGARVAASDVDVAASSSSDAAGRDGDGIRNRKITMAIYVCKAIS